MPPQRKRPPSPLKIVEDIWASRRAFALVAAVELDIFSNIAAGKRMPSEIAHAIGADPHAVERLCETLTALKYLRKSNGRFSLEPVAEAYFVRGGELYMEGFAGVAREEMVVLWSRLSEVVKSGKPAVPRDQNMAVEFFRMLVKAIFPTSYVPAQAAVAAIPKSVRARIHDILDLAAGSGAWSLPFAQAIAQARVSALDYPQVLEITREYAQRFGVADRYTYIGGDLDQLDFGQERYDLVLLGHILHGHSRDQARKLIERSAAALRDKGMLLIAEFIPNDQRTGPEIPLLFGLNMLVATPEGDVYTMREYRSWLKAAGMKTFKTIRAPQVSPLILAGK